MAFVYMLFLSKFVGLDLMDAADIFQQDTDRDVGRRMATYLQLVKHYQSSFTSLEKVDAYKKF